MPFTAIACSTEDPRSTEELVTAAPQGDQAAMIGLENRLRNKVEEDAVGPNDINAAQSAMLSSDPHDLVALAENGNMQACLLLGQRMLYEENQEGLAWMEKAVDSGNLNAVYIAGKAKFLGLSEFIQESEAGLVFLEQAAENGNARAAYELGTAYRYGTVVEANRELAIKWLGKSKAIGFSFADDDLEEMMNE